MKVYAIRRVIDDKWLCRDWHWRLNTVAMRTYATVEAAKSAIKRLRLSQWGVSEHSPRPSPLMAAAVIELDVFINEKPACVVVVE